MVECIEESGIKILEDGTFEEFDSLKFVSFVVVIEEKFDINFPDNLLLMEHFVDVEVLCNIVQNVIDEQKYNDR